MPVGAPSFSRGAALGRRDVPHAEAAAARPRPVDGRRRRGRLRARTWPRNEDAITILVEAIEAAGFTPGEEIAIALDPATSEVYRDGAYHLAGEGKVLTPDEMVDYWTAPRRHATRSCRSRTAWPRTTGTAGRRSPTALGDRVQLVGDDLFVTNARRLRHGHRARRRQLGARQGQPDRHAHRDPRHGRAGDAQRVHVGDEPPQRRDRGHHDRRPRRRHQLRPDQDRRAVPRSDRVAKYNQLLRLEADLGESAAFRGRSALNPR